MAGFYSLAYFIFTCCLVTGLPPKYVLMGTKYNLNPFIPGQPTTILWKHNGNKVVEFDGSEQLAYKPFEGRITLDWHSAELEITELRFEDSGDYDLEVEINHNLHTLQHKLEVIDKVVKPTISCEKNKGSSPDESKTKATLLCTAKPRKPESLMKFEWKSQGMLHTGPKLPITLGDEQDEVEYSCSVSNPLSSETASFTAKQCYKDKISSVPLIAGLCVSILLLFLLVIVGVIFCKRNRRACFAPHDAEKQSPTEGTGKWKTQAEEGTCLLDRNETLPSQQRLVQGHVKNNSGNGKENKDEHKEPAFAAAILSSDLPSEEDHLNIPIPESSDNEEANNQDQDSMNKDSTKESFYSASEVQNDTDPADVSGQSPEDEQFGLKANPKQSGLENNEGEQEELGSTPASLKSYSHSHQDPGNDPDIYTSDPDQLNEAAEKEDPLSEPSDTEGAKDQDRANTPKESTEEDPQSDPSASTRQTEPDPADDSGAGTKRGDPEELTTLSSSEPSSSQDQDHHAEINKNGPNADEHSKTAETGLSMQNPSDSKDAQDPADSAGLDEEKANEAGNSLPLGGASAHPSDGDTTLRDHESDPEGNQDSDEDGTKIMNTTLSPSPVGAESTPQEYPNLNPDIKNGDSNADQSKDPTEEMAPPDQTDSGEKNKPGPADGSQSDDAAPKPSGYVRKEVGRIDQIHDKDGQTPLQRGRESTNGEQRPPLSPLTPGAVSPLQKDPNPVIKNCDPDADQSKEPAEDITQPDQTNSGGNNEPGPADEDSVLKPSEQGVKDCHCEVKESSTDESGPDQVKGDGREEAVPGSDSSGVQQS